MISECRQLQADIGHHRLLPGNIGIGQARYISAVLVSGAGTEAVSISAAAGTAAAAIAYYAQVLTIADVLVAQLSPSTGKFQCIDSLFCFVEEFFSRNTPAGGEGREIAPAFALCKFTRPVGAHSG